MQTIKTLALVLRRTNYGDADRIVQFLTPLGQKSAMAKGARREKSKLAGGIELFGISEVVIGQGKGDMGVLMSARSSVVFSNILKDYDRMEFGYEAIKLTKRASENVDEPEWFDLLNAVLSSLNDLAVDLRLVETWFYVNYAKLMGHEMNLATDVGGEGILELARYRYDIGEQGLKLFDGGELAASHIKLLRLVSRLDLDKLSKIGGVEDVLVDCLLVARQHAGV